MTQQLRQTSTAVAANPAAQADRQHDLQALRQAAQTALAAAKKRGATQAAVSLGHDLGFDVNVRRGTVDTLTFYDSRHLNLIFYRGHKKAAVSTSDLDSAAVERLAEKAARIAEHTQEDPCHGLADATLMTTHFPQLDLYRPWSVTPQHAVDLAIDAERQCLACDKKLMSGEDGIDVATQNGVFVYANTHGFMGDTQATRHSIGAQFIARADNGDMEQDYHYAVARHADTMPEIAAIAKQAAQRTLRRLNARKIKTRKTPVVFEARVARGIIRAFLGAVNGHNLYRKHSFLTDSLRQPVFAPHISLDERPHLPGALGSRAFDAEGLATQAKDIVRDGVLQSYLLDSYSARKLNAHPTGNAGGVHNLFLSHDTIDLPALLKKMDTGLLVTDVMGHGVNLVTGDYSQGASGFWVERGEIQYPVNEITVAGNLKDMFARIIAVANDAGCDSNIRAGSLLIEEMTVAGA